MVKNLCSSQYILTLDFVLNVPLYQFFILKNINFYDKYIYDSIYTKLIFNMRQLI